MSSPSLENILKHMNISTSYISTKPITMPLAKNINNNPEADNTGLLNCGCYDVCHNVCKRFHHNHYLAIHSKVWRDNIMTFYERKQLLSDVVDIKDYGVYHSTSQCSHCNIFYPPAFLVYPNETGKEYKPMCIPCVAEYALPNESTLRILREKYGPKKAQRITHYYYAIARNLIRHPDIPLHNLVSCQTATTVKWFPLDEKYYFFDMNLGLED